MSTTYLLFPSTQKGMTNGTTNYGPEVVPSSSITPTTTISADSPLPPPQVRKSEA